MSIFSENIRLLRDKLKYSQQKVADDILITRGRYATYEDGRSEPPIDLLIKLSKYYKVSIDFLVSVDIRKYPLDDLVNLGDNRIIFPIKIDKTGENKIEIITQKASMGYLNGYSDPEYIDGLQTISLPFLRNGKYRAFPATGDSMPPYKEGTFIVGKYMEDLSELKTDKTYVFITSNDGILYKRFQFHEGNEICITSDNNFYEPLKIHLADIKEIWEFACSINTQEFEPNEFREQNVRDMFLELKRDIKTLKAR